MKKDELRKELKSACSTILILFNLWTSPNAFRVLSIIVYFINKTGKRHHIVSLVNTVVRIWRLYFLRSSRTMGSVVILGISWLTILSQMTRVLRQYFKRFT